MNIRTFALVLALSVGIAFAAEPAPWKSVFNGKNLEGWEVNDFAGAGEVKVEDGKIVIHGGVALSGLRRTNDLLRSNYEVQIKAMKVEGGDFFCGLTFPVKDKHATLVVGGWGGALVGISSLDGMDASENDTAAYMRFETGKWYTIKLRVTDTRIQTWIDKEKLIDTSIVGKEVSMRLGEIEESAPFGIATYQTTAAIQEIKVRPTPAKIPRVLFLAGKKSHGPGEHEYEESLLLLQGLIDNSVAFIDSHIFRQGWPFDEEDLEDADTIVLFSDGADHGELNHPLLVGTRRLKVLGELMDKGVGLVALHYSLFLPREKGGDQFLKWVGGHFDYESGDAPNKWFSRIETREFKVFPGAERHPVSRGVEPFSIKEEFYFNIRFPKEKKNITPIATLDPEKSDSTRVVGWAIERPDGGRGFGYTGGHFHKSFEHPQVQQMLINAILWTARADDQPRSASKKSAGN